MVYTMITGASGGIGEAFARLFASKGHHLFLVARTKSKLEKLKEELEKEYGVFVEIYAADLSVEEERKSLFAYTDKKEMVIDHLINNAGFGDANAYFDASWERHKNMVELNILALMHLSYIYGNEMKKRRSGKILNISSVAAFSAGPYMSVYYASKAFVLSFSEALHEELKTYGVHVSVLCPGPTATEFEKNAGLTNSKMFAVLGAESAEAVAKRGYRGMMKNKAIIDHSKVTYGFHVLTRLLPRSITRKITKEINQ